MLNYENVVNPMDMLLYRSKLSTPKMREIWCEENIIRQRLRVEAVLAEVQAEMGMIPAEAAREIQKKATLEYVKPEKYVEMYDYKGHDIVALIWTLAPLCEKGLGEYVHWRSTTQDILWTSTALMFKDAVSVLLEDLRDVEEVMVDLAEKHKLTLMAGRTHGQHCPPITFGFYIAVLALAVRRHIERLKECAERLLVGKITSAVGTGSSYGTPEQSLELQKRVCEKLGLGVPPITESEITRDRVAEVGNVCSLIATTFEKLGSDISTYQRPEIGEVEEPFRTGEQVGSSTLAHKRNPFGVEWVQGAAKMVRAHAYALNELYCNDVRDGVRLAVEYMGMPAVFCMTSAFLQGARRILAGLTVNAERMRRNMEIQQGLYMDEPVMLELADHIGRQSAHDLVYDCSMRAFQEGRPFLDVLLENETVNKYLSEKQIREVMNPENYLGTIPQQVEATVRTIREAREKDQSG
ncbi:MAG: adenylosuccinate lyase [Deltaproteobacteria bacterium]|nr:adenylosuccinate lyase [Deltaproteobacteria bacterium]MBW2308827.1 adenylosuccinate lyase [Deltaproteobacteria bacterium]